MITLLADCVTTWRILLLAGLLFGVSVRAQSDEEIDAARASARSQIPEFFESRDYRQMETLLRQWQEKSSLYVPQYVVSEMLRPLRLRARYTERLTFDVGTLPEDKRRTLRHDLADPAGRAVWGIEQLIGVSLPRTDQKPSDKQWAMIEYLAQFHIAEWETGQPHPPQTEKLPLEERIRLASSKDTPTRVMAWLGLDPDPVVRRIVAASHSTPPFVRDYLEEFDDDAEVRKTAARNLSAAGRDTWHK